MPRLAPSLLVILDPVHHPLHTSYDADEDRVSQGTHHRVGVRAGGCNPHRRVRLLEGLGYHVDAVKMKVLAIVLQDIAVPSLHDDVQGFPEGGSRALEVQVVAIVGTPDPRAAHSQVKAPLADVVHSGGLFGHPDGVGEG